LFYSRLKKSSESPALLVGLFHFTFSDLHIPNWVPVGPFWVELWVELENGMVAEAT